MNLNELENYGSNVKETARVDCEVRILSWILLAKNQGQIGDIFCIMLTKHGAK